MYVGDGNKLPTDIELLHSTLEQNAPRLCLATATRSNAVNDASGR
jgi:hypothetical protein